MLASVPDPSLYTDGSIPPKGLHTISVSHVCSSIGNSWLRGLKESILNTPGFEPSSSRWDVWTKVLSQSASWWEATKLFNANKHLMQNFIIFWRIQGKNWWWRNFSIFLLLVGIFFFFFFFSNSKTSERHSNKLWQIKIKITDLHLGFQVRWRKIPFFKTFLLC